MLKYLILLFFISFALNAHEDTKKTPVPYEESIKSLKSIQESAIVYGSGESTVYVFLDPLCPYSRQFLSLLAKNEKMLLKYHYYIFLYEIPRLHSDGAIVAIYDSKKPLETLLSIMLNDAKLSKISNEKIDKKINTIKEVAQRLNVNKRPFLIVKK